MSIALYMDENVHRGITNGIRQRQVDVLTVQEDNRAGVSDPEVLDQATELERVLSDIEGFGNRIKPLASDTGIQTVPAPDGIW